MNVHSLLQLVSIFCIVNIQLIKMKKIILITIYLINKSITVI